MIEETFNKTDDVLANINDFLRRATDRITPNVVLLVAIFNGGLIGLTTTGFMGESSLSVKSLSFFLIIWQFGLVCFFSARYVDLTVDYLNKFGLCGFVGFFWQWQLFGMMSDVKTITPPAEHPVVVAFLAYATFFFLLGYCFRNTRKNARKLYSLKEKNVA